MSLKIPSELNKLLEKLKSSRPSLLLHKAVSKKNVEEKNDDLISNDEIRCILNIGNKGQKNNDDKQSHHS